MVEKVDKVEDPRVEDPHVEDPHQFRPFLVLVAFMVGCVLPPGAVFLLGFSCLAYSTPLAMGK